MVLDKNGWIIMLVYSLSQGLVQMWQSSMVINLTSPDRSQRVSETFANYLGVSISFVSVAVSISIATMMDYFRKKMKLAICSLLLSSGLIFILCTLMTEEVIQFENLNIFKGVLSTLLVIGISLSCACAPIAFEFAVELCFPIAEGTIGDGTRIKSQLIFSLPGTWLTLWFNMLAVGFFLVFQIPNVGILRITIVKSCLPGWDPVVELCASPQCLAAPAPHVSSEGAVQERRP